MKKTFLFIFLIIIQFGYSQLNQKPKEAPYYAEKLSENHYKIFKISFPDNLPLIYDFKDGNLLLIKKYTDVNLFENDYAYLEKITSSKNNQLVTAFIKDKKLYEAYSQKRQIEDYNEQTIEIYLIENSNKKLIKTFPNIIEFSKDEFFNDFFTF